MSLAPVVLFVYKRQQHTEQVIEALQQNSESAETDLIIYSDAPKAPKDKESVDQVRAYIRRVKGFRSIRIIEQTQNKGLSESVIEGVTAVCSEFGRVIVLEDDLRVSPYFLRYMNEALVLYEQAEKVISIHGYCYPIKNLPETFFLKGADCWGWATWERAWKNFEPDAQKLYQELISSKELSRQFDFDNQTPYTKMLERQILGEIDSWAIRWYANAFLKQMYTLYVGRSLVQCIGNDGSGTHVEDTSVFDCELRYSPVMLARQPIEENKSVYNAFCKFFHQIRPSIWSRLRNRVRRLLA